MLFSKTHTLAGRATILFLLPFSISERVDNAKNAQDISTWIKRLNLTNKFDRKISLSEVMMRGFFPEIATQIFRYKMGNRLGCHRESLNF